MKKLLLLLLTLLLLPMAVSADDDDPVEEVEIDGIYYRLDSRKKEAFVISHPDKYSGNIDLPKTIVYGKSYHVTGISDGAFKDCSDLLFVYFPFIISIGDHAFEGCSSLTSTPFRSVTYIGMNAFDGCSSLPSINIPGGVTYIGGGAFANCSSLTSIVVEEVNSHYDSRDNCNAIIDKANNMLIAGCKNTVIPSSVTSIGDGAFKGCSSLTSITIPSSVTSIGNGAFEGCSSLTSITIPSSVTSIGIGAFQGCSSMTSITILSSETSIENGTFYGCSTLTDVYCSAENAPSASPDAFDGSSYETATLHVPASSVEKYKAAEPWKDFGNIVSLPKCAKPTIASANGRLTFSCEMEGVEFVASVKQSGSTTYKGSSLLLTDLTTTYRVSVYARKERYDKSEAATIDIDYLPNLDDVNGDGQISISDVVGIVDIILKGN